MPTICHHLGRFIERVRAEAAVHAAAMELSALASTDALTGLKNRREFDRALRTIPRLPFAVLSLDVDRLKDINDSQGHAAGDALLRVVGHTLGLLVRGWDVMARSRRRRVRRAASRDRRLRRAIWLQSACASRCTPCVLATGPVRITVGWSAAPAGADPASVWQRADESLYHGQARRRRPGCRGVVRRRRGRRHRRALVLRRGHAHPRRWAAHHHVPADRRASTTARSWATRRSRVRRDSPPWTRSSRSSRPHASEGRFATSTGCAGAERSRRRMRLPAGHAAVPEHQRGSAARPGPRRRSAPAAAEQRRPRAAPPSCSRSPSTSAFATTTCSRGSSPRTAPRASASHSTTSARAIRHSNCSPPPRASS